MCACVSNNGYIITGPDTCTSNLRGFLRIFFNQNVIFNHSSELYTLKLNAKPKQILIPSSEVFDGSLVRLVIVSCK